MRIGLVSLVACGLVAFVGCGGKVVVDVGDGLGGAGGSSTSTTGTGTPMTSTGSGLTCSAGGCAMSDDGFCQCEGACNGQDLQVVCQPVQGGASCTCIENGIKIAVCVQPGAATCSFSECCAAEFFGQAGD
ncbi:MAG: hypothetical protein QM820_41280 [Minicystis sp.]